MALTYWRGHVQVDIRHWNQKQSLQCKLTSILKDGFFGSLVKLFWEKMLFSKPKEKRKNPLYKVKCDA